MEDLVFIARKGGTILLFDGYEFYKNKTYKSGTELWQCALAKTKTQKKCFGSITIKEKSTILKSRPHTCTQDVGKNEIEISLHKMREQACTSNPVKPLPQIYKECVNQPLRNSGIHLINKIPSSVKSSAYRKRNKSYGVKKLFYADAIELEIPSNYNEFVIADYSYNKTRIIAFCTEEAKKQIPRIKNYMGDGTFKVSPNCFSQLFTIHGDVGSHPNSSNIVPLIYVLMTDRTEKSYHILFSMLQSQLPDLKPVTFLLDFEIASKNAIMNIFKNVQIKHCYFHFSNSIWKKGKKLNLTKSKVTRRIVALSGVLPLLPAHLIPEGWAYIIDDAPDLPKLKSFKSYMNMQWLKNITFIDSWSLFGLQHRTTNYLESWHKTLNSKIIRKAPSLLNLLQILKDDALVQIPIMRGLEIKVKTKEQIMRDDFIINSQMMLSTGEISVGHFLERVKN